MHGFNGLLTKYWVSVSTLLVAMPLVAVALISMPTISV